MINILDGFITVPKSPKLMLRNMCTLRNKESYYNTHVLLTNQTSEIAKIYTTYDNKNSLIFYKNGSIHEHYNKTVKLRYIQDIIHINIVSNNYFERIYNEYIKKT